MECKVRNSTLLKCNPLHWNISRMECKVMNSGRERSKDEIGIYPEWNVKIFL